MSTTGELIEKLEDAQMQLGGMATNRYSNPFKSKVNDWITKLSTVSEIVEMWLIVQNMYVYWRLSSAAATSSSSSRLRPRGLTTSTRRLCES